MSNETETLADYGWSSHFQSQLKPGEALLPVRVSAVHRNGLEVVGPGLSIRIPPLAAEDEEDGATIGDWLLLDAERQVAERLLERKSLFKRRAAGTGRRVQLIAANVDTLFIVSSCNQDFNPARLERYLALAREAEVMPVVVLTKADLAEDPRSYAAKAEKLLPGLLVEVLDARSADEVARLAPWCGQGQTVAFVGSSGVGKSTLVNTLTGSMSQATAAIREDDAHGRHTTTGRSLHRLAAGGWLLDTPGMRELQLADVAGGIEDVFADLVALAGDCRFADCRHESEPDCAVRSAIESGEIEAERLARYRKLANEERRNSEELWQRHARDRQFGRLVREVLKDKRDRRGEITPGRAD
jgi:ribosome biogenesis GTPase